MKASRTPVIVAIAVAALSGTGTSAARAGYVVDQSYVAPPGNLGAVLAEGAAYVGQTVTTGITGNLVGVELNAARRSDFLTPWLLDIQKVSGGLPTGEVVSSTLIQPGDFYSGTLYGNPTVPLPMRVFLSTPVFLKAGDPFAMVLHPVGAEGSPGLLAGLWAGNPSDGYSGGAAVFGPHANSLQLQGFDLHFRTLVDPVPEPSALVLTCTGMLMASGYGLRQRRLLGTTRRSSTPTAANPSPRPTRSGCSTTPDGPCTG